MTTGSSCSERLELHLALARTVVVIDSGLAPRSAPRNDEWREPAYLPSHFGARFSANAFGPSI